MIDFEISTLSWHFSDLFASSRGNRKSHINSSPLTDLDGMVVSYCVLSVHTGAAY
jgi:hypothetical protein